MRKSEGGKLREKDMGDYLYNSEMGPRACVSICQAAWSTHGLAVAHLLSLTLHCILLFQSPSIRKPLYFLWLVRKSLNLFHPYPFGSSSCSNLTGFFFLSFFHHCSSEYSQAFPFPLSSAFSHLPLFPVSSRVVFGLCSPHPQWFSSHMDSLSIHRQPHAIRV